MAELQHDRVPEQTLTGGSAPGGADFHAPAVTLSIQLRTATEPDGIAWRNPSPAACLTLDMVSASGGVPESDLGNVLSARFSAIQPAVLAARRLQWALSGFSGAEPNRSAEAAMLISSGSDLADQAVSEAQLSTLRNAAPGQILLTPGVLTHLRDIPGFATGVATDADLHELHWAMPGSDTGYAADEQAVLGFIAEHGLQDPAPVEAEAPRAVAQQSPAPGAAAAASNFSARREHSSFDDAPSRKLPIIGGIAAVILITAAVLVYSFHKKPDAVAVTQTPPAAAPAPAPAATPAPQAPPTLAAAPVTPAKPSKTPAKDAKQPPSPVNDRCDLSQPEIQRYLDRAERSLHSGDLATAQNAYESVIGCASVRQRAQDGLKLIKARKDAHSLSGNQ